MRNINEILFGYLESYIKLSIIISEKAKGDWSKYSFLIENHQETAELFDTIEEAQQEFREATSFGQLFTYPTELQKIYKLMVKNSSDQDPEHKIEYDLELLRDMVADLMCDGEEDYRVKALDNLTQLPNYAPDDWIRRKYLFQGIYLPPHSSNKIPEDLIQMIEETCFSFIYGNFFASIALARAATEIALKERFPSFRKLSFDIIVNKCWFKVKGLKEHADMQKIAESIRTAGNQIMHKPQDKVIRICNEFATTSFLRDFKSLIEFLYQDD